MEFGPDGRAHGRTDAGHTQSHGASPPNAASRRGLRPKMAQHRPFRCPETRRLASLGKAASTLLRSLGGRGHKAPTISTRLHKTRRSTPLLVTHVTIDANRTLCRMAGLETGHSIMRWQVRSYGQPLHRATPKPRSVEEWPQPPHFSAPCTTPGALSAIPLTLHHSVTFEPAPIVHIGQERQSNSHQATTEVDNRVSYNETVLPTYTTNYSMPGNRCVPGTSE
jgi:hypothetical protein